MDKLVELRHQLHQNPELSGQEIQTSRLIKSLLEPLNPDVLYTNMGGYGVVAIFDSHKPGNSVLYRADIDALPINEVNILPYGSSNAGISHKCGHDGHCTILCGFAKYISESRPQKGKAILLFQPAEETGAGASGVINDNLFSSLVPDLSFAMHNLPGYPANAIVIRENTFTAASKGMIIKLKGQSSHASEPEKGNNPAEVLAELMKRLPNQANSNADEDNFTLITIIHANLGSPAFGTSPGEAMLMLTLRAYSNKNMEKLTKKTMNMVGKLATAKGLQYSIEFTDEFPATINHKHAVDIVRNAAKKVSYEVINANLPFKWSEDFSHFTSISQGAMFGIGDGINHLPLHHPDYDFPDAILKTGIEMWKAIYMQVNF